MNGGVEDVLPRDPAAAMVANIAEFGNDIATLVELQSKLASLDFAETRRRATLPLVLLAMSGWLLMGLPIILMFGAAELIVAYVGWNRGWALMVTAAVVLTICGAASAIAAPALSRSLESFRRSRDELNRNVSWIRTVLVHSGRGYSSRP